MIRPENVAPTGYGLAMSVGYLLSNLVGHLPMLAVLVAGFVLVSARGRAIGPRSAGLARLGLAVLTVTVVLQLAWSVALPRVLSSLDSTTRFGIASFVIGMFLALLSAAGIALILAAVVTRAPAGPGPPHGPAATYEPGAAYGPGAPYEPGTLNGPGTP